MIYTGNTIMSNILESNTFSVSLPWSVGRHQQSDQSYCEIFETVFDIFVLSLVSNS